MDSVKISLLGKNLAFWKAFGNTPSYQIMSNSQKQLLCQALANNEERKSSQGKR